MAPTPSGTKRADSPSWLKIAGLSSPLTSAEKRVLAALANGSVADVHSGGARQPIRAGLIRAIALGLAIPIAEIDPRGLHLIGAVFAQRIELDDVSFARPLRLIDCELEAGLSAERAELHLLELGGCTIGAPDSTNAGDSDDGAGDSDAVAALMLDELRATHGVSLTRSEVAGGVRLLGATIGGQLDCSGGTFTNDTGPALAADRLTTTSTVSLRGTFTGHGKLGAIRLLGANIGGQLDCSGGTFTNNTGPALGADGLTTSNSASLNGAFTGHGELGAVRLLRANIGGPLVCDGGTFTNNTGPALIADLLTTTSDVFLRGTFTGHGKLGAIRLLDASIGGQLTCDGGTFTNNTGPALSADGLTTSNSASLNGAFTGHGELGAVRLLRANIGGPLVCDGGTFTNNTGPALSADGLTTTSSVFLRGTFSGQGQLGAVRLVRANIGGQLACTDAIITNDTGPALRADSLTTASDVSLRHGTFTGHGQLGAVRLVHANIGGRLECFGGSLSSKTSGALVLDETKVQSSWDFDPALRSTDTPRDWLSLDGFTFPRTPNGKGTAEGFHALDWARLLSTQTARYDPQPYQHLAAAYRAAGHEQDAKAVLIAQQDDRRNGVVAAEGHGSRAFTMWVSKLFTGYGYQSSRALWWLLSLAAIAIALAFVAGNVVINVNADPTSPAQWTTVLAHKPTKSDFGTPCSPVELVGVGIDWAVPIVATKAGEACLLNSTHPYGQWWTATSWLFHVLGWAFATLAVAGYTGLIRKL